MMETAVPSRAAAASSGMPLCVSPRLPGLLPLTLPSSALGLHLPLRPQYVALCQALCSVHSGSPRPGPLDNAQSALVQPAAAMHTGARVSGLWTQSLETTGAPGKKGGPFGFH